MDTQVAQEPPTQAPCRYSQYLVLVGRGVRPPDELTDSVIERLTEAVRHYISNTRWYVPPRRFGYDEQTWNDHFSTEDYPQVVTDYYLYLFGDGSNLNYLLGRVTEGSAIGGLVEQLLISRFLFALQNENDPIGYAVYANVRSAVDAMVTDARLHTDQRPRRNDTPVRFPGHTDPIADERGITQALRADPGWPPLLPRLGRRSRPAQQGLQSQLATFPRYGVWAFTAQAINNCLREPVRVAVYRWHALPVEYDPETGVYELFRTVVPDWSPGSLPDLHARCLRRLRNLREQVGTDEAVLLTLLGELIRLLEGGEPIPSGRRLGAPFGIDRRRVSESLAELVRRSARLPEED